MKGVLTGVLLVVLILGLLIAGTSCTKTVCSGVSLTTSELITDLQQGIDPAGGNYTATAVVTIKDTSLTAVIDGHTYCTTIPTNFDAFQAFAAQIANGTVTINYEP